MAKYLNLRRPYGVGTGAGGARSSGSSTFRAVAPHFLTNPVGLPLAGGGGAGGVTSKEMESPSTWNLTQWSPLGSPSVSSDAFLFTVFMAPVLSPQPPSVNISPWDAAGQATAPPIKEPQRGSP